MRKTILGIEYENAQNELQNITYLLIPRLDGTDYIWRFRFKHSNETEVKLIELRCESNTTVAVCNKLKLTTNPVIVNCPIIQIGFLVVILNNKINEIDETNVGSKLILELKLSIQPRISFNQFNLEPPTYQNKSII